MLREIRRGVAQRSVERRKRWFQDEYFDLYVWQDLQGAVLELQICYERGRTNERALVWKRGHGYAHNRVDSGDSIATVRNTPLLVQGGKFGGWKVRGRLAEAISSLDPPLASFILEKVKDYCDPPRRFPRRGRAAPDWLRRLRRQPVL